MEKELQTSEKQQRKKLETKDCCFFCLTVTVFKSESVGNNSSSVTSYKETVGLKFLQRYMQIGTNDGDDRRSKIGEIEADLCKCCARIFNNFSKLFSSLEKIQIEINYWLERIQQQISEASKKPEMVQTYSKRMTSDAKALAQLVFVDNLRKEIAKKSLKTKWSLHPIIELSRLDKAEIEKYSRKRKSEVSSPASESSYQHIESNTTENEEFDFEDNYSLLGDNEGQQNSGVNLSAAVSSQSGSYDDNKIVIKQDIQPNVERFHKNLNRRRKSDKCGSFYLRKQNLKGHMEKCDGTERPPKAKSGSFSFFDAKTRKFNCKKCKKSFGSCSSANAHYHSVHLRTKYKCDGCKLLLSDRSNFNRHQRTCKTIIQSQLVEGKPDPRFLHNCPTCGKGFTQRTNMERHQQNVHLKQKKYYACDHCEKKFSCPKSLNNHKNKIHFGIMFDCTFCNGRFERKDGLILHQNNCMKSVKLEPEIDAPPLQV